MEYEYEDYQEASVCINDLCNRKHKEVYTDETNCRECGEDLYAVSDEEEDDLPIDGLTEQEQIYEMSRLSTGRTYPVNDKSSVFSAASDVFSCPSDLSGCPIAQKPGVIVPLAMYHQWIFLAKQLDTEWIAYLKGEQREDGKYVIREMYFPKQRANRAHCDAEDGEILPGTIAAVHSHVDMQVFFSAEDQAHFNHAIEMVVNSRGEIKANGRTQLECGRWHRGDAEIIYTGAEENLSLEQELRQKITHDHIQQYRESSATTQRELFPTSGSSPNGMFHSLNFIHRPGD